jgi:protein-S-isoprenylcysteine O-methyltransferase Ste14
MAGILLGVTIHLFFAVTVWNVYHFFWRTTGRPSDNAILIDTLLGLQFGVSHSLFLCPPMRKLLGRWISRSFYGCCFCLITCLSLGLAIWQWRTIPGVVWQATGIFSWMFWVAFIASWVGLFYSLSLVGLGYQTGFTEWSHWVRRHPLPPRTFKPRGAYFILRHPVYLSFLGLLWFTPSMTADRALLTGIWTAYIYIGSWLKDLRLAHYLGDDYRDYCARVPGYPGMLFGPLARWRSPPLSARVHGLGSNALVPVIVPEVAAETSVGSASLASAALGQNN